MPDAIEILDLDGESDVDGCERVPGGYRLTRRGRVRDGGLHMGPGVGLNQNREDGGPPFTLTFVPHDEENGGN